MKRITLFFFAIMPNAKVAMVNKISSRETLKMRACIEVVNDYFSFIIRMNLKHSIR